MKNPPVHGHDMNAIIARVVMCDLMTVYACYLDIIYGLEHTKAHMQAFIDKFCYNAKGASLV